MNRNNVIKIICVAIFMLFNGNLSANKSENLNDKTPVLNRSEIVYQHQCIGEEESNYLVDCTIRIKNDNGTDLKITFHDISLFECAKIKIGKFFRDVF